MDKGKKKDESDNEKNIDEIEVDSKLEKIVEFGEKPGNIINLNIKKEDKHDKEK